MPRILLAFVVQLTPFLLGSPLWAARAELLPDTVAAEHGLVRPWFTQVQLDPSRGRLRDLVLYDGALYAQTDKAVIHAIDAETGKTLWWKQIGDPIHPTMPLDANRDLLAVINGSRIYVLNRLNGDLLYDKEVGGAPGAGPALSTKRVYIPMNTGMLMAYRLDPEPTAKSEAEQASEPVKKDLTPEEKAQIDLVRRQNLQLSRKPRPPMFCQSYGKALVQPLVTRENANEEYVVWPTDRGFLNLAHIDRKSEGGLTLKYRLETGAAIVGRPDYLPPDPKVNGDSGLIVVASRDGFVYAVREKNGELLWRFSVGEPIIVSPAVIGDRVYVTAQLGGMYCLEVKTGKSLWFAPEIVKFVAVSKNRVYAADHVGRLAVLNVASGARLDTIDADSASVMLMNTETDRIYLADDSGLIQCLHEVEQSEPIVYGKDRKQVEEVEEPPEKKPIIPPKEMKQRPATTDHVAPKTPVAPRERPAPKERPKRTTKRNGAAQGDAANPFDQQGADQPGAGGAAAGRAAKASKARKAKAAANNNANPF